MAARCSTHQVFLGMSILQFKLFTNAEKQPLNIQINPACLVEGMEEDIAITRYAKVIAMLIGTTKAYN